MLTPTRSALNELNKKKTERQIELGKAYNALGGSNTALQTNVAKANPAPSASIPVLEKAITDLYEDAQDNSKLSFTPAETANVGGLQAFLMGATGVNRADDYNRVQANADIYNQIKNDNTARILSNIGQTDLAPISTGHIMGMSLPTGLTPEMQAAGLTREDLERYNDAQNQQTLGKASRQIAEDHPVLATLGAVPVQPISSAVNSAQNLANYIQGKPIQNRVNPANVMRQTVAEGIDSGLGRFGYNVANSAADMLTALLAGPGAPAVMGLEKGSEVINDAVDRGLNPNQIMEEGIGSALTTAATEAIPLGRISQGGNIFGAMAAEGLQEGAENIADMLLDQLVTRTGGNANRSDLATRARQYIDAGYTPEQAVDAVKWDYLKELGLDVAAGAVSGGALGAGSNAIQGRNIITGNLPTLNNETETNNDPLINNLNALADGLVNQPSVERYNQFVDLIDELADRRPTLNSELESILNRVTEYYEANEASIPDTVNRNVDNVNTNVDNVNVDTSNVVPRDSMGEEQSIQDRRLDDLARLTEQLEVLRRQNLVNQRMAEEQQATTNNDMAMLSEILSQIEAENEDARVQQRRANDYDAIINALNQIPTPQDQALAEDARVQERRNNDFDSVINALMQMPSVQEQEARIQERRNRDYDNVINALLQIPSLQEQEARIQERRNRDYDNVINALLQMPSINEISPVESAQQIVDNYISSLRNATQEQATQGYNNVLSALTAIGNENPNIKPQIREMWANLNNQLRQPAQSSEFDYLPTEDDIQSEDEVTIPQLESEPQIDKFNPVGKIEPVSGLTFGTAHVTDNYVDIDGYSNRKSEKALLNELAKAVEKYDKAEADNLRSAVKFNEITQYPASADSDYILEWEKVPGASRNVDADGVDVLLSERDDAFDNSTTEEAPANYYVHIRFPKAGQEIPTLTLRDIRNYERTVDQYKQRLAFFENPFYDEALDESLDAIRNNEPNAVEDFNNLINEIEEDMQNETIDVSSRDAKRDDYDFMKSVTDGRVIKVTDAIIHDAGLKNLKELNDNTYTRGGNRIVFRKGKGMGIDAAYDEMYEMAHGKLPSPESMAEGDLLRAVYDFIQDAKTGATDTDTIADWESTKALTDRSDVQIDLDDHLDEMLGKIDDGLGTAEDFDNFFNYLNQLQKDHPEVSEAAYNALMEASNAYRERISEKVANADVDFYLNLDNANEEELNDIAEEEVLTAEIPREHNASSGIQTGRLKKSRVFTNTAEKGGMVNDKIRELDEKYGHMMYAQNSEEESMAEASKRLEENDLHEEVSRLFNKQGWTNVDADEMMMIYHDAKARAEELDAQGLDSEEAWGQCYEILEKIKEEGSRIGQALQAYAKWSRSHTPEGLLAESISIIEKAKNWNREVARETKNAFNYRTNENGKTEATRSMELTFMKDFLAEANKLEAYNDGTRLQELIDSGMSEEAAKRQANHEFKQIYDNLGRLINTQIPAGMVERVRTLLMDNMLGNARTLLTRNAGGNVGFNLVEQLLRKPLSGLIDSAVSKRTGKRTVGDVNPFTAEGRELYKKWGGGVKEAFAQEIYDFAHGIHSARSGEDNLATATGNNRTVFKNNRTNEKKGLNYLLNKADNLVRYGLSAGDRWAYEGAYAQTVAEFNQLRKDGKLDIKTESGKTVKISDKEFNELVEREARLNALEACYQDDSEMAQAFLSVRRFVNNLSRGLFGTDILSQFTIPFAKTPANIIQRAVEYSPLGLVKNAVMTIREVTNPNTDLNQKRFSVETSRNIIGSALFALAIGAAKAGALSGGYSEDKDMQQAQKEAGMQEYALNLGDGKHMDISWLPVLGNNMVAAAAAYDAASKPELTPGQQIEDALSAGIRTQFETSALQGLSRLVGGNNSYNAQNSLLDNAKDTIKSGATQFIPSLLRQYAAATDPYRRQLSGPNPDDYYLNSVYNSIPGLRENLEPRITRTGEYMEQNAGRSTAQKWLDNFLNPATITQATPDAVRDEAMRLFESTGNNVAFEPTVSIGDLRTDDHEPTPAEFTAYQQDAYGNMNRVATQMINSDFYAGLNDAEKESVLAEIYSAIKGAAKANAIGKDPESLTGATKAYNEGGADALLDYVMARNYLGAMGMSNNEKNRNAVLETMAQGGTEAVQEMVDQAQSFVDAGYSVNMQYKYDHATDYLPSLTPTQFVDDFKAMDSNGNESLTQDEVIAFLNQNPGRYDNNTATQYWNAYGQSNWKKIPTLNEETGQWEAKAGSTQDSNTQNNAQSFNSIEDIGQYGAGNIDLYNRPQFRNSDGSVSTVSSMSINEDGKEILIPTIAYNVQGKPYRMTDAEAIARYHRTGEYLGKFNSLKEADAYAELLHLQQDALYAR